MRRAGLRWIWPMPASVRAMVRAVKPTWILNPAAYTAVDKAETERGLAYAVNADAVEVLGAEARACGAAVIHFSTDYVFPGEGSAPYRETDATRPLGVYGASKLAGEQALAASGAAHVILAHLVGVWGDGEKLFADGVAGGG